MRKNGRVYWVLLVCGAVFCGCSAQHSLNKARTAFSDARAAGTEAVAPYPFYAAEAYLQLAEHESDTQNLKRARIYADRSTRFSAQALRELEALR